MKMYLENGNYSGPTIYVGYGNSTQEWDRRILHPKQTLYVCHFLTIIVEKVQRSHIIRRIMDSRLQINPHKGDIVIFKLGKLSLSCDWFNSLKTRPYSSTW